MATKKEEQKAMLVSAAATNEPYTSKHTGEEIDSAIDKALAMDPYTKAETDAKIEEKADVSALSDYVKTEKLTEVFKTYGIDSEQDVPILKQTIGYESRNLFDYKKGPDIVQFSDGLQIDIADEIHIYYPLYQTKQTLESRH